MAWHSQPVISRGKQASFGFAASFFPLFVLSRTCFFLFWCVWFSSIFWNIMPLFSAPCACFNPLHYKRRPLFSLMHIQLKITGLQGFREVQKTLVIWIKPLTEAHLLLLLFSNLSLSLSQGRRKNQKGKRKTARVEEKRARKASTERERKMERKEGDGERGALI